MAKDIFHEQAKQALINNGDYKMDKITRYRQIIQKLLTEYANYGKHLGDVERQLVFDTARDHYQIVNVGWHKDQRIYGCSLHLDIKNDKVWIQHNGTEIEIGEELAAQGIPKQDIVIGFHSPYKRRFTEFAVS